VKKRELDLKEQVMSAIEKLEKRIAALEADVARLKKEFDMRAQQLDDRPWWEKIYRSFADNPHYEEAMRLGREYRESTKPKARKKKSKTGPKKKGTP
jgi:hypothetical protein